MFSGVFIAEAVDGVGKKGSGGTTVVDVQTLLETTLNMSLRSGCLTDKTFSDKKENSALGTTLLKCQINKISNLPDVGLKEFCCTNSGLNKQQWQGVLSK